MALTAARTELNVSLVGEDETIRMLEDAKRRMGELEAKTRSLTGATKAQTDAAKAQQAATSGVNATLGRLGEGIAKPLEGIGRLKEAVSKGIEVFGFLGMAVNGAIGAFNFISDAFDDSAEKAAKHKQELESAKIETDRLKSSTDALRGSLSALAGALGAGKVAIATQRARIATLRGDVEGAAFETREAVIAGEETKLAELAEKRAANMAEITKLQETITSGTKKAELAAAKAGEEVTKLDAKLKAMKPADRAEAVKMLEQAKQTRAELETARALARKAGGAERAEVDAAAAKVEKLRQQNEQYDIMMDNQKEIIELEIEGHAKDLLAKPEKPQKPRGGGGRSPQEAEEDAKAEQQRLRAEAEERGRVIKALYEEQKAREAVEKAMREATETARVELFKTLPELQKRIQTDLATLPTGAAFEAVRKQLAEQLKAVNEQMADLKALSGLEDTDLIAQATDKQVEALTKLQQAYLAVGGARAEAFKESEKMREAMARALPADVVNNFTTGLEQLSQMQAPVFEAVQESLAGVAAQMGKFKDGQTSLASAIVGSASAIAGAVAKKVGGVKAEAGVRAAFEVAMGIATAFTNPVESAGHFAAATAFGLLAGGVIKPGNAGASGGQKAPAKPAAATRESGMAGGGGTITNVYNLQTGIVDGQSTAMAFRRAEMTARNTGMASAGGW